MNGDIRRKINNFFNNYQAIEIPKNKIIIRPDDTIKNIYFIKSGNIRQFIFTENGEEISLNIFKNPAFFPIMITLVDKKNRFYFEALTKSEIIAAPLDDVNKWLKSNPDVLMDLAKRFALAIDGLLLKIEGQMYKNLDNKIASILLFLENKFREKKDKRKQIVLEITHQEIANWIGVQRETVSRKLELFKSNGLIEIKKNKIILLNPQKLKEIQR